MSSSSTTPNYWGHPPPHQSSRLGRSFFLAPESPRSLLISPSLFPSADQGGMGSLQNPSRSPLSRSNNSGNSSGSNNNSFNSAVGGDRLFSSNRPPPSSAMGINNMPNSSSSSNVLSMRNNPLFSRDRGKMESSGLSPNTFDPSEFPSLGNRDNSAPNPSLSARPNYVGMVKQPAMEASEFTMSNEDFPALPGYKPPSSHVMTAHSTVSSSGNMGPPGLSVPSSSSSSSLSGTNGLVQQSGKMNTSQGLFSEASSGGGAGVSSSDLSSSTHQQRRQQQSRGIITTPEGMVTNIPSSMVTDQFGMIGLLTFIRAAETDPNLVSLALGTEVTTLGLNLNCDANLYPTFAGPWVETPCRPQDIDYHVPQEYLTNTAIRDKLAPVKLNRYKDDVLFYMFYTNVGDILQLAAAAELYSRDWRFHKDDRVWITRAPGMAPTEKTASYERGTYYFFDVTNWRKVSKDFYLDYEKLENRPSLPTNWTATGGPSSSVSGSPAPSGVVSSLAASTNGPSSQSGIPSSAPQHSPLTPNQSQISNNDSRGGVSSIGAP